MVEMCKLCNLCKNKKRANTVCGCSINKKPDREGRCDDFYRSSPYEKALVKKAKKIILAMDTKEPKNQVHWIDESDCGDLCYPCAEKRATDIKVNNVDIGGGYGWESDSPCFCESCGCPLLYSLTDYGVESELDHFLDESITITDSDGYELMEIFGRYYPNLKYTQTEISNYRIEQLSKKIIGGERRNSSLE